MRCAYVAFHQGWTDIICQLPLLNYYSEFYDRLVVFFREDSRDLVEFYTKKMKKVHKVFVKHGGTGLFYYNRPNFIKEYDLLFHGQYDPMRKDEFKLVCRGPFPRGYDFEDNFMLCFYELYNIKYENRIKFFEIDRDHEIEERKYKEFISLYGVDYVVYHDMPHSPNKRDKRNTRIEFNKRIENCEYVNLHKKTNIFFDYIKILQNSKELHFVDSVWAALYYQLDAKYSIFENKKVNVYCKRGYYTIFSSPIKLDNWSLI